VLLENPGLVYAGVVLGLAVGAFTVRKDDQEHWQLFATVGGGAVLGYVFWLMYHVRQRKVRFWLSTAPNGPNVLAVSGMDGFVTPNHTCS